MNLTIKINLETSQQLQPLVLESQIKACLGENLELMFPTLTRSDVQDWSVEVSEDDLNLGGFNKQDIKLLASQNDLVLSEEEIEEVVSLIEEQFDASEGMSWDSIEKAVTQALMPDFSEWTTFDLQDHAIKYKHKFYRRGSYAVCTIKEVISLSRRALQAICRGRFSLEIAARMRQEG